MSYLSLVTGCRIVDCSGVSMRQTCDKSWLEQQLDSEEPELLAATGMLHVMIRLHCRRITTSDCSTTLCYWLLHKELLNLY